MVHTPTIDWRASYLASHCHRSVNCSMHTKNGRLWRVDDGSPKQGPKHSPIGDGECPSIHFLNGQCTITGLGGGGGGGIHRGGGGFTVYV